MKKDLISISDITKDDITGIFRTAELLKKGRKKAGTVLKGRNIALIFQKPSTRTRVSFEVAVEHLGGHALFLSAREMQLGRGETVADTARILSRYVDMLVIRANSHEDIMELARHSGKPVINALSDREHPCQILSDIFTIAEKFRLIDSMKVSDIKLTYVGDGNNIVNSLLLLCSMLGMKISVCTPESYEPDSGILEQAGAIANTTGAGISLLYNPYEAVKNADFVYTDVWTSMGQEKEEEERRKVFRTYQVNEALLKKAKKNVYVMHCLPAHRGLEITDEVMDGPHSIVYDQAENRLHVQKALLLHMMSSGKKGKSHRRKR